MASQQRRRLRITNPNTDTYSDGYANAYSHRDCNSYGHTHGDPASANAKAAAYTVPSAYAVRAS